MWSILTNWAIHLSNTFPREQYKNNRTTSFAQYFRAISHTFPLPPRYRNLSNQRLPNHLWRLVNFPVIEVGNRLWRRAKKEIFSVAAINCTIMQHFLPELHVRATLFARIARSCNIYCTIVQFLLHSNAILIAGSCNIARSKKKYCSTRVARSCNTKNCQCERALKATATVITLRLPGHCLATQCAQSHLRQIYRGDVAERLFCRLYKSLSDQFIAVISRWETKLTLSPGHVAERQIARRAMSLRNRHLRFQVRTSRSDFAWRRGNLISISFVPLALSVKFYYLLRRVPPSCSMRALRLSVHCTVAYTHMIFALWSVACDKFYRRDVAGIKFVLQRQSVAIILSQPTISDDYIFSCDFL